MTRLLEQNQLARLGTRVAVFPDHVTDVNNLHNINEVTQWKLKKKKKKLPNRNAHDEVIRQVKNELHFIPKKI